MKTYFFPNIVESNQLRLRKGRRITIFISFFFLFIFNLSFTQTIDFTEQEKQWIKDHPVVKFGYDPNWAPFEIYENGEYHGIVGEYIKIIEQRTGLDLQPVPDLTWPESLDLLKKGKIDMVPSCGINESRKEFLHFTSVYINDPMVIVTRNDYSSLVDLSALNGKKVCVPKDYYQYEVLRRDYPEMIVIEKRDIKACLDAVSYGEVDAFVENLGVVTYYMTQFGYNNLKIAAPTHYTDNGVAMAVPKDRIILRDILEKVLQSISIAEKNKIRGKWLSVKMETKVDNSRIGQIMAIGLPILLVIGLLFFIWNRTLRRQIKLRQKTEAELNDYLNLLKQQNEEKKVLLQEIHHRVKNNLQIITSLLRLQANSTKDESAVESLTNAVDRIKTIALIHEKIYQSTEIEKISLVDYVERLGEDIITGLAKTNSIKLEVKSDCKNIKIDSIVPLALILNELFTNSIKYGFRNKDLGIIKITFTENGHLFMTYEDNGEWMIRDDKYKGFGSTLIDIFTEQLEGEYEFRHDSNGTYFHFKFKPQS